MVTTCQAMHRLVLDKCLTLCAFVVCARLITVKFLLRQAVRHCAMQHLGSCHNSSLEPLVCRSDTWGNAATSEKWDWVRLSTGTNINIRGMVVTYLDIKNAPPCAGWSWPTGDMQDSTIMSFANWRLWGTLLAMLNNSSGLLWTSLRT